MNKKKILIIDDEEAVGKIMQINLEATDRYDVRVETMGSKGIETARTFKPDFIFLDMRMPDLNGFEVMYKLQEDAGLKKVPVVFLTGSIDRKGPTAGANDDRMIGAYHYLVKPSSTDELVACIEEHLK